MAGKDSRRSRTTHQKTAAARARARAEEDADGGGGFGKWVKRLFLWGAVLALLATVFVGIAVAFAARSLPSFYQLRATQNGQTIVVRARDGSEIAELGPNFGQWLDSSQIPETMKEAMVAVEDRRFYMHPGVDPLGLMRAVYVAMTGDKRVSATSTITQQLARNVFLNNNRSLDRKLREGILALALEAKFTKAQILELYLNKVYFGGGAYGIDSASRTFFSHPGTELSIPEAAIIAGMVKAPSHYSPTADVDAAIGRAGVVLGLMRDQGYITASEAQIDPSTVKLKAAKAQNSVRYFTDWALPQLDVLLPVTSEPIEVWTTIDPGMQQAATAAVKANAPKGSQGALVSMDRDGAVLALVGGTDYVETNYNRAVTAQRQPGSAWKLFVYLAALEAGYKPEDRVVDTPVTIDGWTPRNSSGRNVGETNLRTAFAYSINTVAAQLGNEVGFGTVASMARRFGITTPVSTYPSMVLGSNEVRLIDMVRAFAAVSAKGQSVEPYGIVKVTSASGEVLYQHERSRPIQLVPDYVAAGITDLLQTAVNTGTGRAAQIGRPVAGKTGTTSSNKDGYFVGFSSGITTGVWMGRDDSRVVPGLQGGTAPARAFAAYMRYAVKDRPVTQFETELTLPEWQIEPDDEAMFGNPDDYYFVDEQGNLIERGRDDGVGDAGGTDEVGNSRDQPGFDDALGGGQQPARPQPGRGQDMPQAASDDFLDRATGSAPVQPRTPPRPQPTGTQPPR
ncbi:transglycosylase domain-containing protein [Qipengyuania sp.]|uniref:transglycosylase domain-containing protein n=1 Tax=Qipengyuania sp. TaxID=2004515 RepID=UPI0035C7AB7C